MRATGAPAPAQVGGRRSPRGPRRSGPCRRRDSARAARRGAPFRV